jgi:hypothetical protein
MLRRDQLQRYIQHHQIQVLATVNGSICSACSHLPAQKSAFLAENPAFQLKSYFFSANIFYENSVPWLFQSGLLHERPLNSGL